MSARATHQISLLLFDEVELLDYAGPYEVFTTATRMHARQAGSAAEPLFKVCSVANRLGPVRARAGLQLQPDADFTSAPAPDLLIVPGGVVDGARADAATLAWIARTAAEAGLVASVCTGAFLLADAGVLPPGARCTTHWEDLADLRRAHPQLQVLDGPRWVWHAAPHRAPVCSSAGISAGIDMALHLVERLAGRPLAERTARQMDYRWLSEA
ncbi:MAG: DJ-1/PfpI family protein [Leptothrix sp. (in: b-proteobacteria)]